MKISSLAVAATAFLHLKGPDGVLLYEDGKKVGIDLYGPGSAEYARIEERQSARIHKRMQDNDDKVAFASPEVRRTEAIEDLTDLTAAFHHIEYDAPDGTPLAGRPLHVAVYSDKALGWINEQALKFVNNWGKFSPGSTGS